MPNSPTDEIVETIGHMKASAKFGPDETKLMRRAVLGNHEAFGPAAIRGPSAREALDRLFPRHQEAILETGVPGYNELLARRAEEPRFHATLLTASLLTPALFPFYRKRSPLDFLMPNGITRAQDDRNVMDTLLIMNKTCAAALEGGTLSLTPFIRGIAARLGATLQAHRSGLASGGPSASVNSNLALVPHWSLAYEAPNHVATDRIMYHMQESPSHVADLSDFLSHLTVAHHGPGFRENGIIAIAYARTIHCLSVRGQIPLLLNLRPGGVIAIGLAETAEPPISSPGEELGESEEIM